MFGVVIGLSILGLVMNLAGVPVFTGLGVFLVVAALGCWYVFRWQRRQQRRDQHDPPT